MHHITTTKKETIVLAHGAGGAVMQDLIKTEILNRLRPDKNSRTARVKGCSRIDIPLEDMDDSGVVDGIAFTTDSHTVKPLFFPGGDIGSLSVAGTVNDLAVIGAEPLALSLAMVIEEGFPLSDLAAILNSIGKTAKQTGVPIITGDTKVVERGALDKIIINTSGIGRASPFLESNYNECNRYRKNRGNVRSRWLKDSNVSDGDVIIVSGTVGDHGVAILSSREGYGFQGKICSDVAPLNAMVAAALREGGIVAMKDATRGGLANALNEWAEKSGTGVVINEGDVPVRESVLSACEMLGIDPLTVGNEGKAIIAVVPEKAEAVLKSIQRTKEGRNAAIIGKAQRSVKGVVLETSVGGRRILEQPSGDPVPRIC